MAGIRDEYDLGSTGEPGVENGRQTVEPAERWYGSSLAILEDRDDLGLRGESHFVDS
jgi:hypothetical protein